jgi:predicted anti-sigma-YlaC factor YlaD
MSSTGKLQSKSDLELPLSLLTEATGAPSGDCVTAAFIAIFAVVGPGIAASLIGIVAVVGLGMATSLSKADTTVFTSVSMTMSVGGPFLFMEVAFPVLVVSCLGPEPVSSMEESSESEVLDLLLSLPQTTPSPSME